MTQPRYLDPEIVIPISRRSTEDFHTGAWSRMRPGFAEKTSPCRAACPNGNNIARAVNLASKGEFDLALGIFLEETPLPGVCGRVCYHPCQGSCNRLERDGAVNIRALERAASELGEAKPRKLSKAGEGHPVAVVGSGPAGLAAAYHAARLGHPVTLIEAADKLGGLLASGIPSYRLPAEALQKDLDRILSLGITVKTGVKVDQAGLEQLLKEHEAVFLSTGGWEAQALGLENEDAGGVLPGLAFLQNPDLWARAQGAKVAVIGGGNTALDAARTALRQGAGKVTVVYRRDRAAMPGFGDEVDEATEEGVEFRFLTAPAAFIADHGKVSGIRLQAMELVPDPEGGRPRPQPAGSADQEMAADLVLVATGQGVGSSSLLEGLDRQGGRVKTDSLGRTSIKGLYAGGDLTPVKASVVDALASGKRAAAAMHLDLTHGDSAALDRAVLAEGPGFSIQAFAKPRENVDLSLTVAVGPLAELWTPSAPPAALALRPATERAGDMAEAVAGLGRDEALAEAGRCYYCGVCIDCGRCSIYCPEVSLDKHTGQTAYETNADYCKGCGACAAVCVRGVLTMSEDQ